VFVYSLVMETSDSPAVEDCGETLRESILKLRNIIETQVCNTPSAQLCLLLHPLNRSHTLQDITHSWRKVKNILLRLSKYKSDPSNDVGKIEKLSRTRHSLRASKSQFQSFTRQLQETSLVFRVEDKNSSKHDRLLARLELCSVLTESDFFVTRHGSDMDIGGILPQEDEKQSTASLVTISTTSLLIDISVDVEKGIQNVSCRFYSQDGDEFTDDQLCHTIECWLRMERFSIFEEKLRSVWKLDKMDQRIEKVDIVKLLHRLRSLFWNVYVYERSRKCIFREGHGWIAPDLEGVFVFFYACCRHLPTIIAQACSEEATTTDCMCRGCHGCAFGVVSVREEYEKKQLYFPPMVEQPTELEQEAKYPVDLQKWVGDCISAELCFVFTLEHPIKMTLTTARLLLEMEPSKSSFGNPLWDMSSRIMQFGGWARGVGLEESLLQDCGNSFDAFSSCSSGSWKDHRTSCPGMSVESYLEYEDGRRIKLLYSSPLRFLPGNRCILVDAVPFVRVDRFIGILGILRQQLLFNQLFQSLFCSCGIDGTLLLLSSLSQEKPSHHNVDLLMRCYCKKKEEEDKQRWWNGGEFFVEVVVHPPCRIELYVGRRKTQEEEWESSQVIISIASHGVLKVSMDWVQHVTWFEKLLRAIVNIPICLFHLWEKRREEEVTHPQTEK